MRIVFLGIPLAALVLHLDGHEIVLGGVTKSLSLGRRKLERWIGGHNVVESPHKDWEEFRRRCDEVRPDLLVSWFFVKKIPGDVIRTAALGGIGAHPSLLPRHRGPDPFFAVIDQGESVTGVTIHKLTEEYDTGDIIAQRPLIVRPGWNAWQLARRLDRVSLPLLRETVAHIEREGAAVGISQDPSLATEAPLPTEQQQWLDWNESAEVLERRVRALAPQPGALTTFAGHELTVLSATVVERQLEALSPGDVVVLDGLVVVRTRYGGLGLERVLVDGEPCRPDDLANLIAQNRSDS